jgi:hypothetical protein
METIMTILRRQFDPSFAMLREIIDICPQGLWESVSGGYPFWQQIMHTLMGTQYWLRESAELISEPDFGLGKVPDLGSVPDFILSREQVRNFADEVAISAWKHLDSMNDEKLIRASAVNPKTTYLDNIIGQIRHIQYHVGHCDAILREHRTCPAGWIEYGA